MIEWIMDGLANLLITVFNWIITGVATVLGWISAFLPDSPFSEPVEPPDFLNLEYIAWFIPYSDMVLHVTILATAVLTYYTIRVLARWIKMVRS